MKSATKFYLIGMALILSSCDKEGSAYYWDNPGKMMAALSQCPAVKPRDLSCEELQSVAKSFRELSIELQMDPQGYGKNILALQETIKKQELTLIATPDQKTLKIELAANRQQEQQRLAVIKYQGSPKA